MTLLRELPALVVLERFPVPVLAIAEDGTILFANGAFAEMLGYTSEDVLSLKFERFSTPCRLTNRPSRWSGRTPTLSWSCCTGRAPTCGPE